MRRSSRILCFLAAATLVPAVAEARGFGSRGGVGMGGLGFHGGMRLGGRPFGGAPRFGIRPGVRPGFGGRFGRGRGFGRYGYGLGGLGLGYGLGDLGLGGGFGPDLPYGGGLPADGGGPGDRPPVFVPVVVPPPACPMIIAVNGGLRHAARTRIVYGSRPACRR